MDTEFVRRTVFTSLERRRGGTARLAGAYGRFASTFERQSRPGRRTILFIAAFGVATAAFWAVMVTSPPVTEAQESFSVESLNRNAPLDLPVLQADTF